MINDASIVRRALRQLCLTASVYDFELTARHIPGVHKVLADSLHEVVDMQAFLIKSIFTLLLQFRKTVYF